MPAAVQEPIAALERAGFRVVGTTRAPRGLTMIGLHNTATGEVILLSIDWAPGQEPVLAFDVLPPRDTTLRLVPRPALPTGPTPEVCACAFCRARQKAYASA